MYQLVLGICSIINTNQYCQKNSVDTDSGIGIVASLILTIYLFTLFTVRLVDGPNKFEGRVEVYHNGEWGTVCDDGWDLSDAQVVCRQLGFGEAVAVRNGAFYGHGNGRIWLSNLNCMGTELFIENCGHGEWGIENCSHPENASVKCATGNFNVQTYKGVTTKVYVGAYHMYVCMSAFMCLF